ncbi:MAG TPA: hypothetical protein VGD72_00210 [Mycobacteriales bacterium]
MPARLAARRDVTALRARTLGAVRAADAAGCRLHTERLTVLGALGIEPLGPVSAARRLDLEVRQGVLVLEVLACRHAADRARAVLTVLRSPGFRRWYTRVADRSGTDAAVLSAFCAAYPGDAHVLDLGVRTELVPAR